MLSRKILAAILPISIALSTPLASANDTGFMYQGNLSDAGAPANGTYDMVFTLYGSESGGAPYGSVTIPGVSIVDGLFDVELDFGAASYGISDRWIEIRIDGSTLSPRQEIKGAPISIQTRGIHVDDNGHVGLGGGSITSELLTLADNNANILMLSQGNNFGPKITLRNTAVGTATTHGRLIFDDGSQLAAIGYVKPLGVPSGLAFGGPSGETHMKITETGFVGIGEELDPQAPLHIQSYNHSVTAGTHFSHDKLVVEGEDTSVGIYSGPGGVRGSALVLGQVASGVLADKWAIGRNTTGGGSGITFRYGTGAGWSSNPSMFNLESNGDVTVSPGGRLGVGTFTPEATLHVEGNARVAILEVTGADLAEKFPTRDGTPIEPGMVLEIDPDHTGMVRLSSGPYSTLVAGVVSGANGLPAGTIMGNLPGMEDATPIALSGRVWVHCDTSNGPIEPGDLLTTSSIPGHAMKAHDLSRGAGAIIGKAMSGLDQDQRGMVLVLVGLQ